MPQQKLTVEVYPDAEAIANDEPKTFTGIDFVSHVNSGTFGPPALVAPNPRDPGSKPLAHVGQKVLYINTSLIPLHTIERIED